MKKDTLLVIGAGGQIGAELTTTLRDPYGDANVIAADLKEGDDAKGPYEQLNVLDRDRLNGVIDRHQVTQVYLLAAMLSAMGERHPEAACHLNMQVLLNVLDLAKEKSSPRYSGPAASPYSAQVLPGGNAPRKLPLNQPPYMASAKRAVRTGAIIFGKSLG